DEDRNRALERIGDQGEGGQLAAAGAQHIGRADIARTDLADVTLAGGEAEQQAEGNRAAQIAEYDRRDDREQHHPLHEGPCVRRGTLCVRRRAFAISGPAGGPLRKLYSSSVTPAMPR